VTLDTAAELPVTTFGLPIRDVTAGQSDLDLFIPGTLLRIDVDPTSPIAYGMPHQATAFFAHSPAFEVGRPATPAERLRGERPPGPDDVHVVARYPMDGLLVSGWMLGDDVIAERAAVVESAVERGRVVLLGFRVQHRAQPLGTFKLLFNALLLGSSQALPSPSARR
jgi:hypothetical protein